jgi:hypothetical protein
VASAEGRAATGEQPQKCRTPAGVPEDPDLVKKHDIEFDERFL